MGRTCGRAPGRCPRTRRACVVTMNVLGVAGHRARGHACACSSPARASDTSTRQSDRRRQRITFDDAVGGHVLLAHLGAGGEDARRARRASRTRPRSPPSRGRAGRGGRPWRSIVVSLASGVPLSGGPNGGSSASSSLGRRRGSDSTLRGPQWTVSVLGSGDGHAIGQYVFETASRIRCPAGIAYAVDCSGTRTAPARRPAWGRCGRGPRGGSG